MYYEMLIKENYWFPWDPTLDNLTGYSTKMTYVEYWSTWSILSNTYIIDADDYHLWVKVTEPPVNGYTLEDLMYEYQCPYNEKINFYEPPEICFHRWYKWHNRWSETRPDRLREIQKNYHNKQYFQLTYDQFRGMDA